MSRLNETQNNYGLSRSRSCMVSKMVSVVALKTYIQLWSGYKLG